MTEDEEREVIRRKDSERARHAVSFLWKKLDSKQARRERAAIPVYARKCKLYGKLAADTWLTEHFGPERAAILLEKASFRNQWVKYL